MLKQRHSACCSQRPTINYQEIPMLDLELYEEMVRLTRKGEAFALATVVAHSGSSPRKAGAKMLVRGDGSSLGTVGGGRVEKETIEAARVALADNEVCTLEFVLTE